MNFHLSIARVINQLGLIKLSLFLNYTEPSSVRATDLDFYIQ